MDTSTVLIIIPIIALIYMHVYDIKMINRGQSNMMGIPQRYVDGDHGQERIYGVNAKYQRRL